MKYRSQFTEEIEVNSPEEAFRAVTHFCDYCVMGAIEQYHCSGYRSSLCEQTKDKIRADWLKGKRDGHNVRESREERAEKRNEQNTQDNEAWFCSLPTEDKAKWFCDHITCSDGCRFYGKCFGEQEGRELWVKWLKTPHPNGVGI